MTRKTWPLLLGSFVVPALLIAACSADSDDDDDNDDGGTGNNTETSSTGATGNTRRTGTGATNSGGGSTNRFTAPSTAGGVLHRGGASAGGRSNQFNTGTGAVNSGAGAGNLAGSAGKANAGAAGLGLAGAASGFGGASGTTSSSANGGAPASGGSSALGVAGAAGSAAICPNGCAAITMVLPEGDRADYAFLTPSDIDYSNASVTLSANVYVPGATAGQVRLLVENDDGSDACRSGWTNLSALANQFTSISETVTGCTIDNASTVAIRFDNNSGSDKSLKIYLTSLALTSATPAQNVSWTATGSASVDTAPDEGILGPATAVSGATLSYWKD